MRILHTGIGGLSALQTRAMLAMIATTEYSINNFEIKRSEPIFDITSDYCVEPKHKGPSNHKHKSKTAHKRKAEKKARKIMRRN